MGGIVREAQDCKRHDDWPAVSKVDFSERSNNKAVISIFVRASANGRDG